MGSLVKMEINAYTDQQMTSASDPYTLQVNPSSIKYNKEIQLTTIGPVGGQYRAPKYAKHKETSLSFDTIFDATGVVSVLPEGIDKEITKLENTIYNLNGEIHRPNFLVISWGGILFKGVLTSLNYEYILFSPEGQPLRVKVSFSFTGYLDKEQANIKENKTSPDLSHLVTLKAGESIAFICKKIYGDPSYCIEVARFNKLGSFRDIKPGTKLLFPPLGK